MSAYLLANHLLNFLALPAMMAVLLMAFSRLFSRLLGLKRPLAYSWRAQLAINFVVGVIVFSAGLALLGRDGKMLTYLVLVLAMAVGQCWQLGGWKT